MLTTSDRIKMIKYRLNDPSLKLKEKLKILDLLLEIRLPFKSKKGLDNWFNNLEKLSEDLIKDERW